MEARNGASVINGAAELADIFKRVQAFWEAHDVRAAADTASTAVEAANAIRSAVQNQEFQAIAPVRDALSGTCQSCHAEYREEVEGGGFQIKSGVI